MRQEIEEMVILIDCKIRLVNAGDIYSLNNAIATLADVITYQNKKIISENTNA